MFLLVSVPHVGAHPGGHQHGVSKQISKNLGETFLRISRIRNILLARILARVFVYLPPFISQIPDFIYWTVLIIILIYFEWRDTENKQYGKTVWTGVTYSASCLTVFVRSKTKFRSILFYFKVSFVDDVKVKYVKNIYIYRALKTPRFAAHWFQWFVMSLDRRKRWYFHRFISSHDTHPLNWIHLWQMPTFFLVSWQIYSSLERKQMPA